MEITYRITEAEYRKARKLQVRRGFLFDPLKRFLLWLGIMVCLIVLWGIVQRTSPSSKTASVTPSASNRNDEIPPPASIATSGTNFVSLVIVDGIAIILFVFPMFALFVMPRIRLRQMYRKDPLMQGQFTLNLTPTSLSIENTAGLSSKSGWNLYEYWREMRGLMILVYYSGAYFTISLAGLSEPQRDGLRAILTTALPKK